MLAKIQKLALFAPGQPLSDRLIIIDPAAGRWPAFGMPCVINLAVADSSKRSLP
jgi:hypothetical protein